MKVDVTILGLGYIGLPTSAVIASNGMAVHGVDISDRVVETINSGNMHIVEPDLGVAVANTVAAGQLRAATQPVVAHVYLIVVPTPFKRGSHEPHISYIRSAT